jgi:hypothetical protein
VLQNYNFGHFFFGKACTLKIKGWEPLNEIKSQWQWLDSFS